MKAAPIRYGARVRPIVSGRLVWLITFSHTKILSRRSKMRPQREPLCGTGPFMMADCGASLISRA